tara:strand:+ start:107 stop:727 length:621 start_codon:yes stop_codon:yes gene_type:complete
MISRGLLISVGVTLLAVGLLFVYFRNKVSGIEKKVELMFNLIQNYEGQQNAMQSQQYMPSPSQEAMQASQMPQMTSELIEVSDDEGDDSEEVSDSEDEEEDEETLKFEPTTIELTETDVKTIDLNTNIEQETEDQESEDSLDEIDSDDDEQKKEEEPLEAEEVITLTEDDYKNKTVAELKQIASGRGLQNYRSLKKAPLIQLLMAQ